MTNKATALLARKLEGLEPVGAGAGWDAVLQSWNSHRSAYWMSKGIEKPPPELDELEVDEFKRTHPEAAMDTNLQNYWAAKISNGQWKPDVMPTELELRKMFPAKRIWRSWVLQLWNATMTGLDMHAGIDAEIKNVQTEGRWIPEALPFVIWSKPGYGPSINFPAAGLGGEMHHSVTIKAAMPGNAEHEGYYDEQKAWYEGYWKNFQNAVSLSLLTGSAMPRHILKLPHQTTEKLDTKLADKVRLAVARSNPALATQIHAQLAAKESSDVIYQLHESLVHQPRGASNKPGRAL